MKFEERSYNTETFRPKPKISTDSNGSLLLVATPWGGRSSAKKATELIQDHFHSSQNDQDVTSPFAKLTCLSPMANDLRISIKLANDLIYNEDNRDEYLSSMELFALAKSPSEISWIQVGHPFPLLDRPNQPLIPLGSQLDLSSEFYRGESLLPPLPNKTLGLDPTSDFQVNSFRLEKSDRIILISHSLIPSQVLNLPYGQRGLSEISEVITSSNQSSPFWIASIIL